MEKEKLRVQLLGLRDRVDLPQDVKESLSQAVDELGTPLQTDVWIYRIVVTILGIIILATVLGGIYIVINSQGQTGMSLPDGIIAIGSAAVGALAGLLAPTSRG